VEEQNYPDYLNFADWNEEHKDWNMYLHPNLSQPLQDLIDDLISPLANAGAVSPLIRLTFNPIGPFVFRTNLVGLDTLLA